MGNKQSDANERIAHSVMNCIPFLNLAYNAVRMAVYAGKGNTDEVARSGLDAFGSVISCIPVAGASTVAASAGASAAAIAGATAGRVAAGACNAVGPVAGGTIMALSGVAQDRCR